MIHESCIGAMNGKNEDEEDPNLLTDGLTAPGVQGRRLKSHNDGELHERGAGRSLVGQDFFENARDLVRAFSAVFQFIRDALESGIRYFGQIIHSAAMGDRSKIEMLRRDFVFSFEQADERTFAVTAPLHPSFNPSRYFRGQFAIGLHGKNDQLGFAGFIGSLHGGARVFEL